MMHHTSSRSSQSSMGVPGEFLTLFNHQKEEQMLVGQSLEFEALFLVFHETKNSGNFQTGENDME